MGIISQKFINGVSIVTYGRTEEDDLADAIRDQLAAIEALTFTVSGKPIKTDLVLVEAREIIRIVERYIKVKECSSALPASVDRGSIEEMLD